MFISKNYSHLDIKAETCSLICVNELEYFRIDIRLTSSLLILPDAWFRNDILSENYEYQKDEKEAYINVDSSASSFTMR